jgi:hypothetical protein
MTLSARGGTAKPRCGDAVPWSASAGRGWPSSGVVIGMALALPRDHARIAPRVVG